MITPDLQPGKQAGDLHVTLAPSESIGAVVAPDGTKIGYRVAGVWALRLSYSMAWDNRPGASRSREGTEWGIHRLRP